MGEGSPAGGNARYSRIAGTCALLISVVALVGWMFGAPTLTSLVEGWPHMAPLTALATTLCSTALILTSVEPESRQTTRVQRVAAVCAVISLSIGALRLLLYLLAWNPGIDGLGLQYLSATPGMRRSSMSAMTALSTVLISGALTLARSARRFLTSFSLAFIAALLAWFGLARYLFGGLPLFGFDQMALQTAVTLFLISTGVMVMRTDGGLGALLTDIGPAGTRVRELLPAALVVPLVTGIIAVYAERARLLGVEQSFSLVTPIIAVVLGLIILTNSSQLRRSDAERLRAETALRESEELLQGLVGSTHDAVLTKTLDGIITSWNPAAERMFGYSEKNAVGRSITLMIPPERIAEEAEILARIAQGERIDHFETVRVKADGSYIDVSVTISPLRDGQGRIVGASKIARDITEQKLQASQIQAQLARLTLLEQLTQAIGERAEASSMFEVTLSSLEERLPIDFGIIALLEATTRSVQIACVGAKSRRLAARLGLSEQAAVDIVPKELDPCIQGRLVYQPDIAGASCSLAASLTREGLRALVITPLRVEGKVFGMMAAARRSAASFANADCEFLALLSQHLALAAHQAQLHATLRQAYEDLRQTREIVMHHERLRSLGQMASGIAHDINNALSPAGLYLQMLLEHDHSLSEKSRAYLDIILKGLDNVGHTVARMRMFYRPRELEAPLFPVALNDLVDQVLELTRARWSDMSQKLGVFIDVKRELAAGLPLVMGAENEIRDALTNLVFNAVDAMPEGGVLTVRTARQGENPGDAVRVEICDTGIGMTEEVRGRCIEPFFTTKGERGSGLGLAMVYGMMQRHEGDLQIESRRGSGTTVRLIFPPAQVQESASSTRTVAALRPLRILIVDDDPLILAPLKAVLEEDGHHVVAAEGGQAGIDQFRESLQRQMPFEIVITDLGMPRVDGRAVAAAVKSSAPTTPVVLLTGWGPHFEGGHEKSIYFDRVLSKSPRLSEVRKALAALLVPSSSATKQGREPQCE